MNRKDERFTRAGYVGEDNDISPKGMAVNGTIERAERSKRELLDAVRTIYEKGKGVASKLYSHTYFTVAYTPEFMKKLGLRGYRFTISYSVIARHIGKDRDHDIPIEVWEQLSNALLTQFCITLYYKSLEDKRKNKPAGFRIYTAIMMNGGFIAVGVEIKNTGMNMEVNSISTIFSRKGGLGALEKEIYRDVTLTSEQISFLVGEGQTIG